MQFYNEEFYRYFRPDLSYNGNVYWFFGGVFATICELDLTYFPFDQQKCDLYIENWSYTGSEVNLLNSSSEVILDAYKSNGEWEYDFSEVESTSNLYDGEPYPEVQFRIFLSRKPGYYMINILTPCVLMVVLALVMFWVPPEAGEKVSLGVTVLLSFSVFQLVIAENSPANSDFYPLVSE